MEEITNRIEEQRDLLIDLERMAISFESKPRSEKSRGFVQGVLEEVESNFTQFKETHVQIYEVIRNNSIPAQEVPYLSEDVHHNYREKHLIFKGKLLDVLNEFVTPVSPAFHSSTFSTTHNNHNSRHESVSASVRLPKINIPTFTGEYLAWIPYKDMFISLVHNNHDLTNVQKYYYLKGSCKDTPLDIVNEYPASDANYELAWKALNLRYHNKRKIVDTVLHKLFSIANSNGSAESIQTIFDTTRNCLALLRTLEINPDGWDAILIYMTVNKLDSQTRKEWEQTQNASVEISKIQDLFSFLETTFRTLENIHDQHNSFSITYKPTNATNSSRNAVRRNVHLTTANAADANCDKRHLLYKCFKFTSLPSAVKRDLLKNKRVCHNCLNIGHFTNKCRNNSRCQICHQPHHTVVHNEFSNTDYTVASTNSNTPPETPTASVIVADTSIPTANSAATNVTCNFNALAIPQVLLATVRVGVRTSHGDFYLRALLDQGAQASLITEDAVQTLKLEKLNTLVVINGVGGKTPCTTRKYVTFPLVSLSEKDFELQCNALVLPSLTTYQPSAVPKGSLPNLKQYALADPWFNEGGPIDLLLGGDVYGDIILPQHKKFERGIFLQQTHFGWIVSGPTAEVSYNIGVHVNLCHIDDQLRAFWEQEEICEKRQHTKEEIACEEYFKKTYTRDSTGRYTVALPFLSILNDLPMPTFSHTDYCALRRLKQIESKFQSQPSLGEAYRTFMTEYDQLGHMHKIGSYPNDLMGNCYFLPHHGMLRESSTTTKLRVVFDGSSKRSPQTSLNEELSAGPALQNDLPTIITRWRRFKIGFRSDLEKMFRQIRVAAEHQKYQQILWRDSVNNSISIYQLNTVTYGTTSAPYLSIRVLQQLARDENKNYPEACLVLQSDTYVDDVISGADNYTDALYLQKQMCSLLEKGGFNLRKWTSNSIDLMNSIPEGYRENSNRFEISDQTVVKALGLGWCTESDTFSFKVKFDEHRAITKGSLLSDTAKLYDPLGWLAPTIIQAKIMFQKLWLLGLDWEDVLPENLSNEWISFRCSLKTLEAIKIPRWVGTQISSSIELHGICDASQSAFAAVVYIKVVSGIESGRVSLLQSKTKVAPLKTVTMPRLELCGATLLAKLIDKIKYQLDREVTNIYYWTDSTTVLSWIRGQSSKWSVYVANRVAEIQRRSNANQWRYISTHDNPADCASRGLTSEELLNHHLWWTGPMWLGQPSDTWPEQPIINFSTSVELRKSQIDIHTTTTHTTPYPDILTKFSSLNKTVRVTAYVLRFAYNTSQRLRQQNNNQRTTGFLQTHELKYALQLLIKISQQFEHQQEIADLQRQNSVNVKSDIAYLRPILDSAGVLRVGGRIPNSDYSYSQKHQIILKKKNPLSFLIFTDAHAKTLHGGQQLMQSYVAQEYWIISGSVIARSVKRRCMVCFKYDAKAAQQIMGNVPNVRTKPSRAFKHSGVDYAGPITIKQSTARNSITTKGYICLFVCMWSKALHLEAVTTLTTESFIAAFKRFTSRRGVCTDLYSDCGTNFIGASKELQVLNNRCRSSLPQELAEILANTGTKWHFIPPAAPNFGGLWEAGVKSTKHHLRRIMKDRTLTYEELSTLLAEIESCLNSRPLSPISNDPSDCNALTPAHFLIGEPTLCVPKENLLERNIDRLKRWKVVEKLKQQFWRRWANECLSRLQARPKWLKIQRNAEVGDLVLIIDDRCPPGQWPLARVQQTHPGPDGCVRVVTLLCNGKTIKRPISKITFLPINEVATGVNLDSDQPVAVRRGTAGSTRRPNQCSSHGSDEETHHGVIKEQLFFEGENVRETSIDIIHLFIYKQCLLNEQI